MDCASLGEIIIRNYRIEPIINISATVNGSGNTFYVNTKLEKYVAKLYERPDFILLYNKIEAVLTERGYIQSKIVKTANNELMTPEAVVLYTFLCGETCERLTARQMENAIIYLRQFNADLRKVLFIPSEIQEINSWDKARSLDFLISRFEYRNLPIEQANISLMDKAMQILKRNIDTLMRAPKQLIHSDLGPDNMIFRNGNVYSVIDFTPEYENEIYSFCQLSYWNYYWHSSSKKSLDDLLKVYYQRAVSENEHQLFNLLMIKAALFRVVGPLMAGNLNLNKRFDILARVVSYIE